jgi:GTPase
VTGEGLPQLTKFLSILHDRNKLNNALTDSTSAFEFDINENFVVPGVGIVVSGIVKGGTAKMN